MDELRQAILDAVHIERPCTVRSCFYRVVSARPDLIDKTETDYGVVQRVTAVMRREGELSFTDIVDGGRRPLLPAGYTSAQEMLRIQARWFRRDISTNQSTLTMLWVEKDALIGVVEGVTDQFGVTVLSSRGYSSLSLLHDAARRVKQMNRPAVHLNIGDHDPSGADAWRAIQDDMRLFVGPGVPQVFHRVAVTEQQIEELELPTRPTKQSDRRAKNFEGGSVEADAIPPTVLRDLLRDAIIPFVDLDALDETLEAQREDRECLAEIADQWTA